MMLIKNPISGQKNQGQNKIYTRVNCNHCGSDNCLPFFKAKEGSASFSATSQTTAYETIVKCQECGLVFVNRRPANKEIIRGYSSKKETDYIKDARGRLSTFRQSVNAIKKYQTNGWLLDVGCAAGFFLKAAKDGGFNVVGVEPNKWLASWGEKNLSVNVLPKPFEQAKLPSNRFDVITFWDTLEHLTDPSSALKKAYQLLRREGILVINYPDIDSLSARIFKSKWWFVVSGHLYYFSPVTIKKMLNRIGFQVIKDQPHCQKLSLFYLLTRLGRYHGRLGNRLSRLSISLGIGNWLIPYSAGQRMVVARKIMDKAKNN